MFFLAIDFGTLVLNWVMYFLEEARFSSLSIKPSTNAYAISLN